MNTITFGEWVGCFFVIFIHLIENSGGYFYWCRLFLWLLDINLQNFARGYFSKFSLRGLCFWIVREHGWKMGRTGHYRGSQVQDQLEPPWAHSSHFLLRCSRHWSVQVEGCSSLCIPRWDLSHALLTQFARTLTPLGFHIGQPEKND